MKPLYLAGPMSRLPQSNFPAFDAAAAELRRAGLEIISPAEMDDPETRQAALNNEPLPTTWGSMLGRDIQVIADQCDGIIFLKGWTESLGARLEAFAALCAGKTIFGYYLGGSRTVHWLTPNMIRITLKDYMP